MNFSQNRCAMRSSWLCHVLAWVCFTAPLLAVAAPVNLATVPLASATTTKVKPNLLFILDDSGSMDWDYLPDYVSSAATNLFKNSAYNGVYYNPAITYSPPVLFKADGALDTATYPSQTGSSTTAGANTTSALPNWKKVKNDGYGIQDTATSDLTSSATFYTFVPGEYCSDTDLKTCVAATAPSASYPYPAYVRWCNSTALTTCQAVRSTTYKYVRYPGQGGSLATITVSNGSGGNTEVTGIKVNNLQILKAATGLQTSNANLATAIRTQINACTAAISGNCQIAGYSATISGSVVTVIAPGSLGSITFTPAITKGAGGRSVTATAFSGGPAPGSEVQTNIVSTTTSYPYPGTTAKAVTRTDCAGATCTYQEEMTNYANWWAYYHTRMQAMKTSVSRAFKQIDNRFRVGFSTISYTGATDGTKFLHVDTFELAHKNSWYTKLFASNPSSYTPLRGALSKAGQLYAHVAPFASATDPIQYSCQQNFTILSTDGYWNTNEETSTYGPYGLKNGVSVGNLDSDSSLRKPIPFYEGPTALADTLADVAKYFYDTDLRTSALGNCTGALGSAGGDVCEDNVFVSSTDNNNKQHMTTFTLGLGVDGTLLYQTDYQTATNGDYQDIKDGVKNWSNPIANTQEERIDDLWHAAVNGRGVYFSARDPNQIIAGFNAALASITSKLGAGAAAATSTLNPVAGDNYAYVASYTTVKWTGNLEARTINVKTGVVSETAVWCAEDVLADACSTPSSIQLDTSGSSKVYYCVTPDSTAATCGSGILEGTNCKREMNTACTGTMASKVGAASDTRKIYFNKGGALADFTYANLTPAQQAYFTGTGLSQWSLLTGAQQTAASGANLVNFLRGQNGYEDRTSNTGVNRLYRYREAVLGDAVESQPAFVGKPTFSYKDSTYDSFVSAQASRAKTVYMGTNDGMLHAFDAETGQERWAYIPSMVMPSLWKLADKNYATMHGYYANGSPIISDIKVGGTWKTILVAGLNGGGRGYYALDVTNPAAPSLLWEFTDNNLGYTFGHPVITKLEDGNDADDPDHTDNPWVVLVTSGYNNISPGDGQGYLYILDANTGAINGSPLATGAGSVATPSGLGKISAWADNAEKDNIATYVYGGDLLGNLWRFDIHNRSVIKFAEFGTTQPITTLPILGKIEGKRVIFVGTGKYLEESDLKNHDQQSLYAIKDDDATATLTSPASALIQQTISGSGSTRTGSNNKVDFKTDRGWYINFPGVSSSGTDTATERQNVDGMLTLGTLLIPTTIPSNTVCRPGGSGYLNFFDYRDGTGVDGDIVSTSTNAPIVGINVIYLEGGGPVVSIVTSDNPTPEKPGTSIGFDTAASSSFRGKRAIWRELVPQ